MKITHLLAAAVMAVAGTSASATTVSLGGGAPVLDVLTVPEQDFIPELVAANATHLYSGPLSLILADEGVVTFSLVAAESSFSNRLLFDGNSIIVETFNSGPVGLPDFTTGVLNGQTFQARLGGGTDLASLLSFDVFADGVVDFFSGDDEFGVFANSANIASLTTFYLALDDNGNNLDDNHDDIIIRVDIAPVPLPAAAWMLLAGLGGLVGMRRLRKTA